MSHPEDARQSNHDPVAADAASAPADRSQPHTDGLARSAYVHVPFCRHRCGYCNFTVVAGRDDLIGDYLTALQTELADIPAGTPLDTLFLGGGTPTHLPPSDLDALLSMLRQHFRLTENAEFSIEANPEDITSETVDVLQRAGVNRVSLGVQTFRAEKLATLERNHTAETVQRGLELLRPAVSSLALDLIFAAPGESLQQWCDDLQQALTLNPDHLSTYGLTFEPGTRFYARQRRDELVALAEEVESAMYQSAIDHLQAAGWEHYEVSNFARAGHRCRHNENYWQCGHYFGIGPGAASYLGNTRRTNHRSTTTYLKRMQAGQSPVAESDTLTPEQQAHERLVFGLRQLDGIRLDLFRQQTGWDAHELVGSDLAWLCDQGLLEQQDEVLRLSRRGLLVSDAIWPYLL